MKLASIGLMLCFGFAYAQNSNHADLFETKIRPLLVTRCGSCHGAKVQMGAVQLTSKDGMHKSGVVVPGDPAASRLITALSYQGKVKMPPDGKLTAQEMAAVTRWVAEGAVWPDAPLTTSHAETTEQYWAFKKVEKASVPPVRDTSWPRSDIDRFILSRLEKANLKPVGDADRYALLRRITLDLTGLLPTADEIRDFEKDTSASAVERIADRLLASSAFGDRWGRHWLDVTYWADTTGSGRRIPLRDAWKYRDYVIQSFNDDKPYDRFIREQIAGVSDASDKPGKAKGADAAVATGFLVLGPWAWISYDREQLRVDVADLQADLVGRTLLGLTIGCARCHDHKFDPIPNKDYFALTGIFLSTKTLSTKNQDGGINTVRLPETLDSVRTYAEELARWEKQVADAEAAEKEYKKEQEELKKQLDTLKAQPNTPEAEIKAAEDRLAVARKKSGSAGDRQILPFTKYMRPKLPEVYAAEDMEFPQDARITSRGDAHQLGESAPRGFLTAAMYGPPPEIDAQSSGRKELAEWIANEKNPLTARVYVNRVWKHLFGEGIVSSTDNFGRRGELPTHPELLDYLAARFMEDGWSTKKLIRQIVLSRVYQLASTQDAGANEIDADNKLLWRANRRRLEAEAIRDTVLQVSNRLDPSRGGPSLPLTAQNVHTIAPFFLEEDSVIEDHVRYRRTVYQPVMRSGQMSDVDILNLFDFADPDQVVGARAQTMVPTQTLFLLNSEFLKSASKSMAEDVLKDATLNDDARVSKIILSTLNRPAIKADYDQARQFLSDFEAGLTKAGKSDAGVEAWSRFCQAILVSSEFLYRR